MANGLVADIGAQLRGGMGLADRINQQNQLAHQQALEQAKREQLAGLTGGLIVDPTATQIQMNPQIAAQMATQFPEKFEQINKNLGLITEGRKQEALDFSFKLRNAPYEQRPALIKARAERLQAMGRNADDTLELLGLSEQDQNTSLDMVQVAALSPEKRIELMQGDKPTTLQKNLMAAGLKPGTPEYQQAIMTSIMKPSSQVSVSLGQEGEERKKIAGVQAERFRNIITQGEAAGKTLASLDQMEALDLTQTGALEPYKAGFASVVKDLGFDNIANQIADVTNAQSLQAVSGRLVQDVLNAATGPQTDQDAARAAKTITNLGDDPKAGQFKLNSLRALSLRTKQRSDFISQKIDEGMTFSKANQEWNKFASDTPNISSSVKDPSTGLPLFFYQFESVARRNNPNATREQILATWRSINEQR